MAPSWLQLSGERPGQALHGHRSAQAARKREELIPDDGARQIPLGTVWAALILTPWTLILGALYAACR